MDNMANMDNVVMNRKLASIQKINSISPIEGADRIEVANMENLAWNCVVKKGEVNIGDLVVYFECDSILPEKPEFEFLRDVKFRVKIRKYKKQVSEGLILPISIVPKDIKTEVGMDLTSALLVRKHDPQLKEENDLVKQSTKRTNRVHKFMMNFNWYRWIYFKMNSVDVEWPVDLVGPKTDEERIQTCAKILMDYFDKEWYICEKIDGQSGSFFTYYKKVWGFLKKEFGVCSRNIFLKTKENNNYWKVAEKYRLSENLKKLPYRLSIQGEICGIGIQSNKYKLEGLDFFVFNIIVGGKRLPLNEMQEVCVTLGLKTVPVINESFVPSINIKSQEIKDVVQFMVELSKGNSKLFNRNREGIVIRLKSNPKISFKVINPNFLLEEKEEKEEKE
jgi:hypothetical protein